ncbi:MAG: Asp-tRNA(Asn)/Glu-tRNA(Gln) amidotransferase subunit GatC [Candidatus Moraniibacteriota bacterium]
MLSIEETKHIASLARIGVTEKDLEKFSHDLSAVLDWVKQLEEVDITDVSPTARVSGSINVSREDNVLNFEEKKDLIKLFPEEKNDYLKVRSVM